MENVSIDTTINNHIDYLIDALNDVKSYKNDDIIKTTGSSKYELYKDILKTMITITTIDGKPIN